MWEQNTFTALKLMPKWRVVLVATSVSAYLQSAESTTKCGMDAEQQLTLSNETA
jgi:hypothetical protein